MPTVFVNYRVQEQPGYATLLHRELAERFGAGAVFLASSSIRPGDDFVKEVFDNLRRCAVLFAVIGSQWLNFSSNTRNVGGISYDWVHREIAEAFSLGIRVIPILIEDAELPDVRGLPADIADLARCQYLRLRHYNIDSDLARLFDELCRIVPSLSDQRGEAPAGAEPLLYRAVSAPRTQCRIGVIPGTIHRVRVADIWVNSENTDMEMSRCTEFSISGIIRYLGARHDDSGRVVDDAIADELAIRVRDRAPVAPGTAVVTGAGALTERNNVRHVIHVAAVHGEPGAGFRQVRDVGWCVTNALIAAERLARSDERTRTMIIPLLGTGVAGAEIEPTARSMLLAALDYLTAHSDTLLVAIYFLAYRNVELMAFDSILSDMPQLVRVSEDLPGTTAKGERH